MIININHKTEKGSSIIELVLVVMAVGCLALLVSNIPSSVSSVTRSKHASIARDVATKQMDYLRQQTYDNLTVSPDPSSFSDVNLEDLPGSAATYEVSECPASVCSAAEAAKQIKIKIAWNEQGDQKSIELATLISPGGLGQ